MRLPRNIFEYGRRIRSLRHALRDDGEQDQGCVQSDALSSVLQRDSDTNSSNFSNNLDYEAVNFQLMEGETERIDLDRLVNEKRKQEIMRESSHDRARIRQ